MAWPGVELSLYVYAKISMVGRGIFTWLTVSPFSMLSGMRKGSTLLAIDSFVMPSLASVMVILWIPEQEEISCQLKL